MNSESEAIDWLVGSPTGAFTRVNHQDPTGAHPLTPGSIRQRYLSEIRNSALVARTRDDGYDA